MTDAEYQQLDDFVANLRDFSPHFSLARTAFHRLADALELDVFFNYIVKVEGRQMWLSTYHGIPSQAAEDIQHLDFGHAVCGTVAQTRTPMAVEDVQRADDEKTCLIRMFGVQAYTCFPLLHDGKLLGTLSFGSRRKTRFTADETELLSRVAKQVAKYWSHMLGNRDVEPDGRVA